jgi:AraC-like DNA-binding protein
MKNSSVSGIYFTLLSDYLAKVSGGTHVQSHLEVAVGHFKYAPRARLDRSEVEALIEQIEKTTGGLSFGLDIGENIHPSDYGIVGYIFMNCANLQQALNYSFKYKRVLNQALDGKFFQEGDFYHYQLDNLMATKNLAPLIELDMASGIELARFLVGKDKSELIKIKAIHFQHQPLAKLERYRSIFNCPVRFGQPQNEVIVSKEVLALPIRSANPRMLKMLLRKFERIEKELSAQASFGQLIYSYLTEHKVANLPSASQAARDFHVSPSTLKKYLKSEDLNYSAICDSVRKDIAIKMVLDCETQIKEIYGCLNFASSSAFNRAFKRWTDLTPTQYRARGHYE